MRRACYQGRVEHDPAPPATAIDPDAASPAPVRRRALVAWAGYDWATGAFFTVISTFVFGPYYQRAVVGDPDAALASWSMAIGVAAAVVAVLAPLCGAAADQSRRKPWLAVATLVAVVATAGLALVRPDPVDAWLALVLVAVGTVGAELAMVFYNAMLGDLVRADRLGRWSGWGWAAGYAGGLACLVAFLFALVLEGGLLGVTGDEAWNLRLGFLGCAVWYAVFALPLFVWTPDRAGAGLSLTAAGRRAVGQVVASLRQARYHAGVLRFLLARMCYTDALTTIFALGGMYAAAALDLDTTGVLMFGIAINASAGCGAFALAWVDDWLGPKPTILAALAAVAAMVAVLLVTDTPWLFWTAALGMGLFLGPAQAASRSLMAHLAPAELRGEMFGLFALAGKATAFLGPWCVGVVTALTASQRSGMATVLVFLGVGALLLLRVPGRRDA